MGWCTIAQVRENNDLLTTAHGWSSSRIQRLISRTTRYMKRQLRPAFSAYLVTWDAADVADLPPDLNDLCLQLTVVRAYIMAYRSRPEDCIQYFIEEDRIEKQVKEIAADLEVTNVDGTVITGTPTSCETQDYPDAADDDYHDYDSADIDRWQENA